MNSRIAISSKPRYEVLDGLRGVAAWCNHGYLVVNAVGFLASIAVAQLARTFYDKPVRKWLNRR